jgi:hypothetical protein
MKPHNQMEGQADKARESITTSLNATRWQHTKSKTARESTLSAIMFKDQNRGAIHAPIQIPKHSNTIDIDKSNCEKAEARYSIECTLPQSAKSFLERRARKSYGLNSFQNEDSTTSRNNSLQKKPTYELGVSTDNLVERSKTHNDDNSQYKSRVQPNTELPFDLMAHNPTLPMPSTTNYRNSMHVLFVRPSTAGQATNPSRNTSREQSRITYTERTVDNVVPEEVQTSSIHTLINRPVQPSNPITKQVRETSSFGSSLRKSYSASHLQRVDCAEVKNMESIENFKVQNCGREIESGNVKNSLVEACKRVVLLSMENDRLIAENEELRRGKQSKNTAQQSVTQSIQTSQLLLEISTLRRERDQLLERTSILQEGNKSLEDIINILRHKLTSTVADRDLLFDTHQALASSDKHNPVPVEILIAKNRELSAELKIAQNKLAMRHTHLRIAEDSKGNGQNYHIATPSVKDSVLEELVSAENDNCDVSVADTEPKPKLSHHQVAVRPIGGNYPSGNSYSKNRLEIGNAVGQSELRDKIISMSDKIAALENQNQQYCSRECRSDKERKELKANITILTSKLESTTKASQGLKEKLISWIQILEPLSTLDPTQPKSTHQSSTPAPNLDSTTIADLPTAMDRLSTLIKSIDAVIRLSLLQVYTTRRLSDEKDMEIKGLLNDLHKRDRILFNHPLVKNDGEKEELKDYHEKEILRKRISLLEGDNLTAQSTISTLTHDLATLKSTLDAKDKDIEELLKGLQQAAEANKSLQGEIDARVKDIHALQDEREASKMQNSAFQSICDQRLSSVARIEENYSQLLVSVGELEEELSRKANVEKELVQFKALAKSLEQQLQDSVSKSSLLEDELQKTREMLNKLYVESDNSISKLNQQQGSKPHTTVKNLKDRILAQQGDLKKLFFKTSPNQLLSNLQQNTPNPTNI